MIKLFNAFVKLTAWPLQWLLFRTKVYCQSRKEQSRRIKGAAIIVSNHTAVYDYAVMLFVFFSRTLRYQMAELLFEKKPLGAFLRLLGGIRVDRNSTNLAFIAESERIIKSGGVVGVFPEGRLPLPNESRPIDFKPGAAFLALSTGAPIIPVYTNGSYFKLKRARVVIGRPINPMAIIDREKSDKENIEALTSLMRERIIELGKLIDDRK